MVPGWTVWVNEFPPEEFEAPTQVGKAAALVQYDMSALEQEHLRVILLDRRNRVLVRPELQGLKMAKLWRRFLRNSIKKLRLIIPLQAEALVP